jgi:V/A-type H+-transporting ATPase subunit E
MAEITNNTERLIERITEAARDEAAAIFEKAREEIERAMLIAQDEIFSIEKGAQARAEREREDILERSRTNAELDARKYALQARREVLDEAFEKAQGMLLALSGDQRRALLERLLASEAEGGESIAVAAADANLIYELAGQINQKLQAAGKATLVPGGIAEGIVGGFILRAAGYEKNCSFEALLRDARAAYESEVAAELFH